MNAEDVQTFLNELGLRKVSPRPNHKGWVSCECPFALWKHKGGSDSSPSFAVKVSVDGPSGYNCFSCDIGGTGLQNLLFALRSFTGESYADLFELVRDRDKYVPRTKESVITREKKRKRRVAKLRELDGRREAVGDSQTGLFKTSVDVDRPTLDESELEKFLRAYHPYMERRGFTKAACKAWGLLVDRTKKGDRIVFPIRDIDGKLLAFSRRVTWERPRCVYCGYSGPDQKFGIRPNSDGIGGCPSCGEWVWPKYLHSKGFQRNLYLYGEHMIDTNHRKGVVVEGNLDPIRLWQLGIKNAVATLGKNVGTKRPDPERNTPGEQLWRIENLFDEILIIADGDKAGSFWAEQISNYFDGRWTHVIVRKCPEGFDPGDLEESKLVELVGEFDVWADRFPLAGSLKSE